jgi:hypothetical protein
MFEWVPERMRLRGEPKDPENFIASLQRHRFRLFYENQTEVLDTSKIVHQSCNENLMIALHQSINLPQFFMLHTEKIAALTSSYQ